MTNYEILATIAPEKLKWPWKKRVHEPKIVVVERDRPASASAPAPAAQPAPSAPTPPSDALRDDEASFTNRQAQEDAAIAQEQGAAPPPDAGGDPGAGAGGDAGGAGGSAPAPSSTAQQPPLEQPDPSADQAASEAEAAAGDAELYEGRFGELLSKQVEQAKFEASWKSQDKQSSPARPLVGASTEEAAPKIARALNAGNRAIQEGERAIRAGRKKSGQRAVAAGRKAAAAAGRLTAAAKKFEAAKVSAAKAQVDADRAAKEKVIQATRAATLVQPKALAAPRAVQMQQQSLAPRALAPRGAGGALVHGYTVLGGGFDMGDMLLSMFSGKSTSSQQSQQQAQALLRQQEEQRRAQEQTRKTVVAIALVLGGVALASVLGFTLYKVLK